MGVSGFWKNLDKPFVGLSPMDGITDLPFRLIVAKYGRPDVIFTEFVAIEALIRGVERAFADLMFLETERPIVAQLYGNQPEVFYSCAQIVAELGFDGVDINMGCPAKSVEQRGAGAGLIRTPELAVEIINAVQEGIKSWEENGIEYDKFPDESKPNRIKRRLEEYQELKTKMIDELGVLGYSVEVDSKAKSRISIPVSIKTRTGYDKPIVEEWIAALAGTGISALSLHGRTLREGYRGKADWSEINKAAEIIKSMGEERPLIIGNGDIMNAEQGVYRSNETGVDGVLIGRTAMGNPWVFNKDKQEISLDTLKQVMLEHSKLHYQIKDARAFVQMRRLLADYIKGFPGASDLRSELVRVNNPFDVEKILLSLDKKGDQR